MKVSSVILIFGILFGSILLMLSFPTYLPQEFYLFLALFPIIIGLKIIDLI